MTKEKQKRNTNKKHIANKPPSQGKPSDSSEKEESFFANFKAVFKAATGKGFVYESSSWNDQVAWSNHRVSIVTLTLCTISTGTIKSYAACYRIMGRAINELTRSNRNKLGVAYINHRLFSTKDAIPLLCAMIGYVVSEEFWIQFVIWRMRNGLLDMTNFRCALLKAQQAARVDEWAGLQCHIEMGKAASVIAIENRGEHAGVGAITKIMMQDLIGTIDEAQDPLLGLVLVEFFGCFRIGEVLNMRKD